MKKLIKSFGYALAGIKVCLKQSNFKIQLVISLMVITASIGLHLSALETTTILLCCAIVLSLEMMNTAIEQLCDLTDKSFNPKIKIIKDAAAGAVLLASIVTAVIGLIIFWPYILK